jgi:hypothetical protein
MRSLELSVLHGATALLSKAQPRIHCEIGDDASFDLLKSYGYTMFDADSPLADRRQLDWPAYNTIALPNPWPVPEVPSLHA